MAARAGFTSTVLALRKQLKYAMWTSTFAPAVSHLMAKQHMSERVPGLTLVLITQNCSAEFSRRAKTATNTTTSSQSKTARLSLIKKHFLACARSWLRGTLWRRAVPLLNPSAYLPRGTHGHGTYENGQKQPGLSTENRMNMKYTRIWRISKCWTLRTTNMTPW